MKILSLLLAAIMLIPAILLAGNIALRETTGADIISSAIYGVELTQPVNESEVCPNAITNADMHMVKEYVNQSIKDYIIYSEIEDKFNIDLGVSSGEMRNMISLDGKQVASLAQIIILQEEYGQIEISEDMYIDVAIKEVDFEQIDDLHTHVKAVLTIDVAVVKEGIKEALNSLKQSSEVSGSDASLQSVDGEYVDDNMAATDDVESSDAPQIPEFVFTVADMIIDVVPDILYVSSSFVLEEYGTMGYDVSHDSLKINNLTEEETQTLFTTIDAFAGIGTASDINEKIATALANALIGTDEDNKGLAYSLKSIGASGFDFTYENGKTYFVVTK